jgi:sugar lactone lactonase YvrE
MQAELLFDAKAKLGEGPTWDAKTQTLYWVDIHGKRIHKWGEMLLQLDDMPGCAVPAKNGHLVFSLAGPEGRFSFVDFDPVSGQQTVIGSVDSELPSNRFNDGKCDPAGRLLAGTMDLKETDNTGSLYSFDGKNVKTLFGDVCISNGLAWSPDHKTFYYIDTPTREVRAFDYDVASGNIANQRRAVHFTDGLGWPDGMTSDTEGNLWVAMWGGAQLTKWNPNSGKLLEQIPVPVLQPSSCVFGGADMNELYITSARKGMTEEELKKYPLSGGVFKMVTKTVGMATFEFSPA